MQILITTHVNYSIYKLGLITFFLSLKLVNASYGENSNEFRGCYHTCHFNNCSSEHSLKYFKKEQKFFDSLLWSCDDECRYECMWHTTNAFIHKGWSIPQFYGKWPFIKIVGLQEPASVLFSLLNLLAHAVNIKRFRSTVPSNAPLYKMWHLYYIICLNAWIWSIVFHARDTPLTEKLDYFCAFSMVLLSLLMLLIRTNGKENHRRKGCLVIGTTLFFFYHVWSLSTRFDYGYNMKVNVIIGLTNGFGWLLWSWNRPDNRPFMFWCRATMAVAGASMCLELLDFPPIWWTFDAHALWHLSTVPLPFMWYRFVIGDCFYLLEKSSQRYVLKKSA